ncbi:unnamed protein product [Arabidopsis halleri]
MGLTKPNKIWPIKAHTKLTRRERRTRVAHHIHLYIFYVR